MVLKQNISRGLSTLIGVSILLIGLSSCCDTVQNGENKDGNIYIPLSVLKLIYGDKLSDIKYLTDLYGEPVYVNQTTYRYGETPYFGDEMDLQEYLKDIPKCDVYTYMWETPPDANLRITYIKLSNEMIPVWGVKHKRIQYPDVRTEK